jgi:hypothetical protein
MNETPHPAVVARRRRLQQLRVRIAGGVVALFIALFSVIYVQTPSTAKVATASTRVATSTPTSTTSSSAATPMTTSQS